VTDPATAFGRRLANRVLGHEAWAREKLRVHAGRAFALSSGPVSTAYVVHTDGTLDPLPGAGPQPDAELYVSPLDLPSLLADPARFDTLVRRKGDDALLETLRELAITLPWFVERGFARAFGPIVGQRLADTGRALLGFPEYASGRLTASVASYARDEAGLLARADEARAFADQTAELKARVDTLVDRVDRLAASLEDSPTTLRPTELP
jgi:ubiquinone biosynthesis protein UbiJ